MKENFNDIADLIGKSLAGETTVEEQKLLESWLAGHEENRVYFNQCKTLFEKAKLKEWQSFDTDAAWNNLKPKLSSKKQKQVSMFGRYWRVAASILIVMSIGFYSYSLLTNPQDVVSVKTDETVKQDTLPDGTLAFLNKETTLAYEYSPRKEKRVVKLVGEAFFEIKENKNNPFVIEGEGGLIIEDIGTSFNVEAYPESDSVLVYVKTGEVAMYTDKNSGIHIMPGETGVYHKSTHVFTKLRTENENVTAYKTKTFTFHQTRLGDLVETLNEVYGKKIIIENEKLKDCRVTVSFKNESIGVIAEVIAETLNLTLTETENEIVLQGEACQQ